MVHLLKAEPKAREQISALAFTAAWHFRSTTFFFFFSADFFVESEKLGVN